MNMAATHSFNPASILAGSTRIKSAGWSKGHPTTTNTMFEYTQKAVKSIVRSHARRLLESSRGAESVDLADLLEYAPIARRDGGGVGPQSSISDLVYRLYTHIVGGFGLTRDSQDKQRSLLAGYWSAGCSNWEVFA